jgi:hypothetical protein
VSEEPDYSIEIRGHRYEIKDASLVAERYEGFLGAGASVELWISPVIKDDVKEQLTASFVVVGPRGGTFPVTLAGLREGDMLELEMRMGEARKHIGAIDAWRKQVYGDG